MSLSEWGIVIIVLVQICMHFYKKGLLVDNKTNKPINNESYRPNNAPSQQNFIPNLRTQNTNNGRTSIIFVGKCGTGKSTLIELLSGQPTIHNSGQDSVQKEPVIVKPRHEDVYDYDFIDTPGFQSTDMTPDEEIRLKIIYMMQANHVKHVKIIWCVEPRERSDQDFKLDCEFIKKLGNNEKNQDIWKSMLVIEKEPYFSDYISTGVLGACYHQRWEIFGGNDATTVNNSHDHYLGITCVDWVEDPIKRNKMQGSNIQIMSPSRIREEVLTKINNLPFFEITYVVQQCEKCMHMFLEQFPLPKCHDDYYQYHDTSKYYSHATETFHDGKITNSAVKLSCVGAIMLAVLGPAITWSLPLLYMCATTAGTTLIGAIGGAIVGATTTSWDCCNNQTNATGCKIRYTCCLQRVGSKVPITNKNCIKVCKHCERPYTDTAPCGTFKHKIMQQN